MVELQKILTHPMFDIMFSLLIGVGTIVLLRPVCTGIQCYIFKSPAVQDWDNRVYMIGHDCYRYKTSVCPCTEDGNEIESFNGQ